MDRCAYLTGMGRTTSTLGSSFMTRRGNKVFKICHLKDLMRRSRLIISGITDSMCLRNKM